MNQCLPDYEVREGALFFLLKLNAMTDPKLQEQILAELKKSNELQEQVEKRIADKKRLQKFRGIWALMIFSVLLYYAWPYYMDFIDAIKEAELQLWLEENDMPRSN